METPELPLEIITYIFTFLQVADRREAARVCKSWYFASRDFQKTLTFRFPACSSSLEVIRSLSHLPSVRLTITHLDGSRVSRTVLEAVGEHLGGCVESLSLPGSSVTEAALLGVLPHLAGLRRLDLSGLDSLFMSGAFLGREESRTAAQSALGLLEELDLSDIRYLSDLTFGRLTRCTPRLCRLSVAGCHLAFEFDPYRGCPVGPDSSALLSLRSLRRLLHQQAHTLCALDLSRTSITPEALKVLARVEGLQLEELRLHGCKELTDTALVFLCKHQPALKMLDLSACAELTDITVQALASELKHLQTLSLSRAWRVGGRGLADLMKLKELQTLDLSENVHISGMELVAGAADGTPLVTLNLKSCSYIRDVAVLSLAPLLSPTLRVLDLTSCLYLTDLSVRAIATHLPALRVLRLGWCKEITDWGLLGMVEPTTEFNPDKELKDKGPSFTRTFGNMGFFQPPPMPFADKPRLVTDDDLGSFREREGASLLALRGLRELDLTGCSKLTDSSITQVLRYPELQRLSLSMLGDITDESLVSVASRCRSLTSLRLSHCSRLSDGGMARASPFLRRLRHLQLSCCKLITDASLSTLAQHCQSLRTLDISMCEDISVSAVDLLQSQLPFLESVQCRFKGAAEASFAL